MSELLLAPIVTKASLRRVVEAIVLAAEAITLLVVAIPRGVHTVHEDLPHHKPILGEVGFLQK